MLLLNEQRRLPTISRTVATLMYMYEPTPWISAYIVSRGYRVARQEEGRRSSSSHERYSPSKTIAIDDVETQARQRYARFFHMNPSNSMFSHGSHGVEPLMSTLPMNRLMMAPVRQKRK